MLWTPLPLEALRPLSLLEKRKRSKKKRRHRKKKPDPASAGTVLLHTARNGQARYKEPRGRMDGKEETKHGLHATLLGGKKVFKTNLPCAKKESTRRDRRCSCPMDAGRT